jgi:tRNA A37 methylthiotransferase MiaB
MNKRASELMELHRKTALENKQKYRDKILRVFVNKKISTNLYESRDENYNIVLVSTQDRSILGKIIQVKIKEIGVHHVLGEMII